MMVDTDDEKQMGMMEYSDEQPADKKRFLVAIILSLGLLVNCEIWISLSAVNSTTMKFFDIPSATCDWFSIVFFVTFAVQAIPSMFVPQLIGIKNCMICGAVFNVVGCFMRMVAFSLGYFNKTTSNYTNTSFWVCIFGNVVASFAQGVLLNIPTLVSSVWFKRNERLASTTLIINGSIFGTAVGFIFAPLIVGDNTDINVIQWKFIIVTLTETLFCTLLLIASIFFVPSAPKYTKSNDNTTDAPFKVKLMDTKSCIKSAFKDILTLLKSPLFIALLIIYGIYYAVSSSFYIILNSIITENAGAHENFIISYIGSLAIILGAIFSFTLCYFIGKMGTFRVYIRISWIIIILAALPLFVMRILSHYKVLNVAAITVLTFFYGMMAAPYLGLGYDIMSRITSPIPENIPITISLVFSNIICISISYGSLLISEKLRNNIFLIVFGGLYVFIAIFFVSIRIKPLILQ